MKALLAIARGPLFGFAIAACLTLTRCATFTSVPRIQLKSNPAGAEITTLKGEVLGVTPLSLTPEMLQRAVEANRLAVSLRAPGYWDRQLALDLHDESTYEIELTPLDADFFQRRVITDFALNVNTVMRELLVIQGLLATKNFNEAETLLDQFQKKYPTIASSYVMQSKIEELRGNPDKARELLKKAWGYDSQDPYILRRLGVGPK